MGVAKRRGSGWARKIVVGTTAAALLTGGALMGASPALAAGAPEAKGGAIVMSAPTLGSTLEGGFLWNTYITTFCWTDSGWANGTNRWFRMQGPGYDIRSGQPAWLTGYISANSVFNQITTPHC
jgi:hypothetical protein